MSAQLQAFSSGSLAADEWYIVVISIEADMIIMNAIWKKASFQTVKLAWNEQVKKNQKRQLTEQAESDNESDFQDVKIEKSKHQKILIFSNHFSHLKIDSMFYHADLSHHLD